MIGACEATDLCPTATDNLLSAAALAGIGVGVAIGAAGLAVGGYVAFKIIGSAAIATAGGTAGDFAAE
jgi:hypothetical protein